MCEAPTEEELALAEIRALIAKRSPDEQILIECMAQSIRNIAGVVGVGPMALALVGAEWAAKP